MTFPVIAAAIDLKITIEGVTRQGDRVSLNLADLQQNEIFHSKNFSYSRKGDYLKSVVKVLQKQELYRHHSIEAVIRGTIPIQAGSSSSSALVVAWTGFLLEASRQDRNKQPDTREVAELAYLAEVEEFCESGGKMDHYTSAMGGIVHLDFHDGLRATPLSVCMREFVLGDSLQPKDTQKTLRRIRDGQEEGLSQLARYYRFKDSYQVSFGEVESLVSKVAASIRPYLRAVLSNHDITDLAKTEMCKDDPDIKKLSSLMNRHHRILRDDLKISTPQIEGMIESSMKAGALAAKINGSGEGGCMFAFCPGKQEEVAEAIQRAGGRAYRINIGAGWETEVM
jgi:galactokinase